MTSRSKNETQIQADAYQYLYNKYPMLRLCLFSVPNEALFSNLTNLGQEQKMALIGRFKASGLTPGVTDMIFYWNGSVYWFELKDDTGTVSEQQKLFHRNLAIHGQSCYICRSSEDVIAKVEEIIQNNPLSAQQVVEKTALLADLQALIIKKKSRKF